MNINARADFISNLRRSGIRGREVLVAMEAVPREIFLPPAFAADAYAAMALPIECGQTISQPYIVAYMTERLKLTAGAKVLEIGTGSGYQAAVLAHIAAQVFSIERIEALAEAARQRLLRTGARNISIRCGDGSKGWPDEAPFDAIVVTAAAAEIPAALLNQLKIGGRMILPLGESGDRQRLALLEKDASGFRRRDLIPVRFVPLR